VDSVYTESPMRLFAEESGCFDRSDGHFVVESGPSSYKWIDTVRVETFRRDMARNKRSSRMAPLLLKPSAKRKATTTVVVHEEPYSIKGFESSMYDIRCFICLGWDQGNVSRLVCNAPVQRCQCRTYLCTSHTLDPRFESYCVTCKKPASTVPDPTATALLKSTALVECTSPQCPELVTVNDMETHLLSQCPFNLIWCGEPGCSVR
jgi:hypothetical protein